MRLHRSLIGEGPQPLEYYLGRLCEEFACLPSEAWAESRRLPVGMLERIIEARAYGAAKQVYDVNPKAAGRMVELVKQIEFAIVQEELAARG